MYYIMAFIGCMIFPYWVISKGIQLKNPPLRVVVVGTIYGVCGAMLAVGIGSICGIDMSGNEQIDQIVKTASGNDSLMSQLGLKDLSRAEVETNLKEYYKSVFMLVPSVFFVLAAIMSYVEYRWLYKRMKKKGLDVLPMTPINEFSLDRSACTGWLLLYLVSAFMVYGEVKYSEMIYSNVFVLFQYVFALQGISFIFQLFKLKRLSKALAAVLSVCMLLFIPNGAFILFLLGFADLALGLKGKINGR